MNKLKALNKLSRSPHQNAAKARELLNSLKEEKVFIGVFGTFSSGKSTVVDALIGKYLLPTKVVPNTAHGIFISNGSPGLTIVYKNGEQRKISLSGGLFSREPAQEVIEQTAHKELGNAYEKDAVDYYLVSYGAPFLGDQAVLVDTPGTNSVIDGHNLTAMEAMDALDIAVYVINAQQPFSETDAKSIKYIGERYSEIIVLVNKIDRFDESEQRMDDFLEGIRDQIRSKGGLKTFYLYPISAKGHLRDGRSADPHNAFREFKEKLSFIIKRRAPVILKGKIEKRIDAAFPNLENDIIPVSKVKRTTAIPWAKAVRAVFTLLLTSGILLAAAWAVNYLNQAPRAVRWKYLGPATVAGVSERLNMQAPYKAEVESLKLYVKNRKNQADTMLYLQAQAALLLLDGKRSQAIELLDDRAGAGQAGLVPFFNHRVLTRYFDRDDFNQYRVELFVLLAGIIALSVMAKLLRKVLSYPRWVSGVLAALAFAYGGSLVYFFVISTGVPLPPDFYVRILLVFFLLSLLSSLTKPAKP